MSKTKSIFILILLATIALLFGLWFHHNTVDKKPPLQTATVLLTPRDIQDFSLIDTNGHPFTRKNLKQHWSLIFFGFTHCPDLCPTTLAELKMAYEKLLSKKQQPMPQVIFISVDPERDTPAMIKRYLSSFHADFIGLTGNEKTLNQLTQEMSVIYMKVMPGEHNTAENSYTIDHSGTVLMINPDAKLIAIFSLPHDKDKIAEDVANIINHR